jgi:hypothetical protein
MWRPCSKGVEPSAAQYNQIPTERPEGVKSPSLWCRAPLSRAEGGLIISVTCSRFAKRALLDGETREAVFGGCIEQSTLTEQLAGTKTSVFGAKRPLVLVVGG